LGTDVWICEDLQVNAYWEIFFSEKVPPDPVELEPLVRGKYYQEGLPQDLLFRVYGNYFGAAYHSGNLNSFK
jgi:hypothetical protein